jgi:hypothetical protein
MNYKDGSYCGEFLETYRLGGGGFVPQVLEYGLFSARECFNAPRGDNPSSSQ